MGLAIEILLVIFGSLFLIALTVTVGVLVVSDKITLPGSEVRRVKRAAADLEIAKYRVETAVVEMRSDALATQRLERALNPGPKVEDAAQHAQQDSHA